MGNAVVYRPAYDAEVEYLESTGTQWIDTGVYGTSDTELEFTASFGYGTLNVGVVSWDDTEGKTLGIAYNSSNNTLFSFLGNQYGSTIIQLEPDTPYDFVVKQDGVWIGSQKTYNGTYTGSIQTDYTLPLFARRADTVLSYSQNAIFYNFKIYQNSTLVRDFIPVRIGSVGYMYDKVTKQLFANKGTGNFILGNDVSNAVIPQQRCVLYFGNQRSVIYERIYEEYEWLCGRNGAYINTEYELTPFNDAFYVKAKYDGSIKNPDNDEQYVFGMRNYVSSTNRYYCVTLINALNKIAPRYCNLGSDNPATDKATNFEVFLSADTNYMYRTLNGVAYPAYSHDGTFVLKSDKAIYLFKANFTDSPQDAVTKYFHGDISSFRITDPTFTTDKMNLIPCKLLQPIPAILDGNGIARQAGECGMWDKVNDKFYGNVASSGSFTVSND